MSKRPPLIADEDDSVGLDDLDLGEPGEDAAFSDHDEPDDPGLDDIVDAQDPPAPVDDEHATDLAELDGLDHPAEGDPVELLVVDWSTEAELIDLRMHVPAILDPTAPRSTLYTPRLDPRRTMRVGVGPVERVVQVVVVAGEREWIRLGRDFLAGAIAVRS